MILIITKDYNKAYDDHLQFSRHALTSHYSFQVSVRGALMSLPTPVQRRGQKMYKSELWETQRKSRENMERIGDWMASFGRSHNATDDGEGVSN